MSLTFGSLFAGIGGLDLGLERAGMVCKWQVEIDEYFQRVLAKHWPAVPRLRDVRDVFVSTVETVDLICGGFPCQPVSVAGKRKGSSDPRWLWPEFARVVDELRPRWVLLENVPGLLTGANGEGAEVVTDLAAMGYDAEWGCVSASAFGAPYRRSRWFCIAHDDGYGFAWGTQQDFQSFLAEFEASRWGHFERCGEDGSIGGKADRQGLAIRESDTRQEWSSFVGSGWWSAEPDVVRVVSGVPFELDCLGRGVIDGSESNDAKADATRVKRIRQEKRPQALANRVDRIRGLGNAVVPQVAEWIGRQIC